MKKNLLLVVAMLLGATAAFAQPRAIGLRVGSGLEASYQHSIGSSNMISMDFGLIYPNMSLAAGKTTTRCDGEKTVVDDWNKDRDKEGWENPYTNKDGRWNMVGMDIAATYDWINPGGLKFPWSHKGSWNWYVGVGIDATYMKVTYKPSGYNQWDKERKKEYEKQQHWGSVGVAGRIGVEYNFWFPLQLSFDWRPVFGPAFNAYTDDKGKFDGFDESGNAKFKKTHTSTVAYNLTGLYAGAICFAVRYKF